MPKPKNPLLEQQRREFTAKCLKEALAIAEALYNGNKSRYKPLFGWINKMIGRRSPALILQSIKRLQEREASKNPALDVIEYVSGTLRKLEQERDAKRLRAGRAEPAPVMDVFAGLLRKAGYTVEKP